MAISKREVLKFTRIKARPDYTSGNSNEEVKGYLNKFNEFSKWDVEREQGFGTYSAQQIEEGIEDHMAPYIFFKDSYKDEYDNGTLSFVIEGVFIPYDRRIHDLDGLAPLIYIHRSDGAMDPFLLVNASRTYKQSENTPPSLIFRVNPTGIKVVKKKLFKKIRTRGGWVFQHWGPDIGSITLNGTTGSLIPDTSFDVTTKKILGVQVPIYVKFADEKPTEINSPALKAFRTLETWYDEDQGEDWVERGYLTALEYRERTYVGHIASFEFNEKGIQPYQFYYTIKFLVHYDASHLQGAITRASNQIVRNQETLNEVRNLRREKRRGLNQ